MLSFYEIDGNYINYLRVNGENRIPRIDYKEHKKFFCGIILTINNINYFAPVSSNKNKMYTSFLIKEINKKTKEEKVLSSLRFSFMFPCPMSVLHLKDFNKEDEKYRILLRKELHYCNSNIEKIKKQAYKVYKLGINNKTQKLYNICDFKKLENKYQDYINNIV